MERMTSLARPRAMATLNQSRIRGLLSAGLLFAGLAGCGTAAASSPPATMTPTASAGQHGATLTAAGAAAVSKVGCAAVGEATTVTVVRNVLLAEPINGGARTYTQHNAKLVRALFGDFCAAISHAPTPPPIVSCPADFGTTYAGTFLDGRRALATFIYGVSGCQRITITVSGHTRGTLLIGSAAAAAPHLKADMAAVLGVPESQIYGPASQTHINQPAMGA
jgi:hypothetical protein